LEKHLIDGSKILIIIGQVDKVASLLAELLNMIGSHRFNQSSTSARRAG